MSRLRHATARWGRALSTGAVLALALLSSDTPAEAVCSGDFGVPLGTSDCSCPGGACKQGCRTYNCQTGELVGWGTTAVCPTWPSCSDTCGAPAAECTELCANGRDDDGDGIASDGCSTEPASACTNPGGCAPSSDTSLSSGNVHLVEPPDWHLARVGPPIVFRRVYDSRWWRPYTPNATPTTALGWGFSSNLMAQVAYLGGTPAKAIYTTEDAREVMFTSAGVQGACASGTEYRPSPGYYVKYLCRLSDSTWELRELAGRKLLFDTSGRLVQIRAKEDGGTSTTQLRVVIDWQTSGGVLMPYTMKLYVGSSEVRRDTLQFAYDASNRLSLVDRIALGQKTIYTYGTGVDANRLKDVELPDGRKRSYTWTVEGFLQSVKDETGTTIRTIDYVANTFGKVEHEVTPDGEVAYRYDHADCGAGQTQLLWSKCTSSTCDPACEQPPGCATSCTSDAQCSAGGKCWGGACYQGKMCVDWDAPNEHVLKDIADTCASCASVPHYEWYTNAPANDKLELRGILEDTSQTTPVVDTKTSFSRDANGMILRSVRNDDDYVATNGSTLPHETVYYKYNGSHPALPERIAQQSTLSTGTCGDATPDPALDADCARTEISYGAGGGIEGNPTQIVQKGWTLEATNGTVQPFTYTTAIDWNSRGQIDALDGPRTDVNDTVDFVYHETGTDELYRLQSIHRPVASARGGKIVTYFEAYDRWGNATRIVEKDAGSPQYVGSVTCRTYSGASGFLEQEKRAWGHSVTDCTAADANYLITNYTPDAAGRVGRVQHPLGNCDYYTYTAQGYLQSIIRSDDCPASISDPTTRDRVVYSYDAIGSVIKEEVFAAGVAQAKRTQEYKYGVDGRVLRLLNPVTAGTYQQLIHSPLGSLIDQVFEITTDKTEHKLDAFERQTTLRRYLASDCATNPASCVDTTLSYTTTGGGFSTRPTSIKDGLNQEMTYKIDDLGRTVEEVSPDRGTTRWEYHTTNNVLSKSRDGIGFPVGETTTYVFDSHGRMTCKDVGGTNCDNATDTCNRSPAVVGPDVRWYYDDLETHGITCPPGAVCNNLVGNLALARTEHKCDTGQTDGTDDYNVFHTYDLAGRIDALYDKLDSVSAAQTYLDYSYDKNSHVTEVQLPNTASQRFTYGTAGDASDANDVTQVERGIGGSYTTWIDQIAWNPSGPLASYRQANTVSGTNVTYTDTRNAAYRQDRIEAKAGSTVFLDYDYDEDARGRYTSKTRAAGASGSSTSHYAYDAVSRLTCDAKVAGSCPAEGNPDLKSRYTYNKADSRTQIIFANSKVSDNLTSVFQTGTNRLEHTYRSGDLSDCTDNRCIDYVNDDRGSRIVDDDKRISNDDRTYTYCPSGQLCAISGKYPSFGGAFSNYTVSFFYDHRNRRVAKVWKNTSGSGAEKQYKYVYDEQNHPLCIRRLDNPATDPCLGDIFEFAWLGDKPVTRYFEAIGESPACAVQFTNRYFIETDHLGTPMVATTWPTSGSTQVTWQAEYDAFGWAIPDANSQGKYLPFRFPGQRYDDDTEAKYWDAGTSTYKFARPGLHENHHRTDDPHFGGYASADPLRHLPDFPFAYADQNPTGQIDSSGMGGGFPDLESCEAYEDYYSTFDRLGSASSSELVPICFKVDGPLLADHCTKMCGSRPPHECWLWYSDCKLTAERLIVDSDHVSSIAGALAMNYHYCPGSEMACQNLVECRNRPRSCSTPKSEANPDLYECTVGCDGRCRCQLSTFGECLFGCPRYHDLVTRFDSRVTSLDKLRTSRCGAYCTLVHMVPASKVLKRTRFY